MTGIQLSANWAVAQAAEALASSKDQPKREAGRSLRCCEVVGLDRLSSGERESNTQGVRVWLRFYRESDLACAESSRADVAIAIAHSLGLWPGAIQLDLAQIENEVWLGRVRPYERGGTGLRLDRYLTDEVLGRIEEEKHGLADWRYLAEHPAQVRILLRRLRYRLGDDYGSETPSRGYGYWTTQTTKEWARSGPHALQYLVNRLSWWSDDLVGGNADPAPGLDPGFWGEVDTGLDPLRVTQLTTENGTTRGDVDAVLAHAGTQIRHLTVRTVKGSAEINRQDPVRPFTEGLKCLLGEEQGLDETDILLVHRGGGVNSSSDRRASNVSDERKQELLDLCVAVRDRGIEVVVALGHANVSVLTSGQDGATNLPLGIFEATTPTAGAAWILQEHINPRLVDTSLIYSQSAGA